MAKRVLITGITGQDGSYLAELLLSEGCEVFGFMRRSARRGLGALPAETAAKVYLLEGDVCDQGSIDRVMHIARPDEVYHLAAQSFVRQSFDAPEYTFDVVALGTLRVLEAVRALAPRARVYVAGSSEQFGSTPPPHNEDAVFHPRSPYGAAKVAAHHLARVYREAYGLHVCVGVLGNHESPRRGPEFVTRKITMGVAAIATGRAEFIELGNLVARRDWGHAFDYVRAMATILRAEQPSDYVVGTGEAHSVREFLVAALAAAGLDAGDPARYVRRNAAHMRPAEVDVLRIDPSRIERELGWVRSYTFQELVLDMVMHDLETVRSAQ